MKAVIIESQLKQQKVTKYAELFWRKLYLGFLSHPPPITVKFKCKDYNLAVL